MALSVCGKCGHTEFELAEHVLSGSQFKFNFVQCAHCGTPVGVLDYYNLGTLLKKQEQAMADMARRLETMERRMAQPTQALLKK